MGRSNFVLRIQIPLEKLDSLAQILKSFLKIFRQLFKKVSKVAAMKIAKTGINSLEVYTIIVL